MINGIKSSRKLDQHFYFVFSSGDVIMDGICGQQNGKVGTEGTKRSRECCRRREMTEEGRQIRSNNT